MRDVVDMKDELRAIEQQLYSLKVQPGAKKSAAAEGLVTRESFLSAQQNQNAAVDGTDEYVYNLIRKPTAHKRSSSLVRPVSRPPTPPSSAKSSSTEHFETRRGARTHSQVRLMEERKRLELDYKRSIDTLKQDLEEMRNKRICDKERYRDELDKYERDMRELEGINTAVEQANKKLQKELEVQVSRLREMKTDFERLNNDMDRMEMRYNRAQQRVTEVEGQLKGQDQAYDTKIQSYEIKLEEYRDREVKFKSMEERYKSERETLQEEVAALRSQVATEKAISQRLNDDMMTLRKKQEAELEDFEGVKQSYLMRIHNGEVELSQEQSRLNALQQQLRETQQEKLDLQAKVAERDKLHRELASLKELHETVSNERLHLQTQYKILSDELSRLRDQLSSTHQSERLNLQRAEQAEANCHQLQKKVEALQVKYSKSIVTNPYHHNQDTLGLTDAEGQPISRLKPAGTASGRSQTRRPAWWFQEDGFGGEASEQVIVSPVPYKAPPVVMATSQQQPSGLTLLRAEKRSLMRELAKLAPSPAYRTTDENETWEKLKEQLARVDADIKLLEGGPSQ